MSNEARFGGVSVRVNEDGTLYLYQPDSNRLMSAELALKLVKWLRDREWEFELSVPLRPEELAAAQSTVPSGFINTSVGPVAAAIDEAAAEVARLTESELEADKNANEARAELAKPAPRRRGPGRPRKTQG